MVPHENEKKMNNTLPAPHMEILKGTRSVETKQNSAVVRQFLTLRLGTERFGISIDSIVEILKYRPATPVPRADPTVHGIVSVRGRIITVIDGGLRLGLEPTKIGSATRIIVVHDDGEQVGLLVDAVIEVLRVPDDAVEPAPATVAGAAEKGVLGICDTREESLLILLDMSRFLNV